MGGIWYTLREEEIFIRYFNGKIARKEPTLEN
jgi:hypothetical protein